MFVKNAWKVIKETVNDWLGDNVPEMGAALAYYSIFSLAPLLLVAIAIASIFFGEQAARNQLHEQLATTIGVSTAASVEEILGSFHRSGHGVLGTVIGLIIVLVGASGVVVELQSALNRIWRVKAKSGQGVRVLVRDRLVAFAVVLGTGVLLLVALVATAVISGLEHFVTQQVAGSDWLWRWVNLIVSFGLVALMFAMIYKVLPDAKVGWRDVWVGAAITAVLFTVGKYLIGLYLAKSAPGSAFGAAGSVIVVLVWVYYSSQILLFGAEFTRVYARHTGSDIQPAANAEPVTPEDRERHGLTGGDGNEVAARTRPQPAH